MMIPDAALRLENVAKRFLMDQDVKISSRRTYERALKPFLQWISLSDTRKPGRADILKYRETLLSQGLAANTASLYITVVRKFFEWLESEKLWPNIAREVRGSKRPRGPRRQALTHEQLKRLSDSIDRETTIGKRDYAIFRLAIATGIRSMSIVLANIEDIRQESGYAVLRIQGKGRDAKDHEVGLAESVHSAIMCYLAMRNGTREGDPLFISHGNRSKGRRLTTRALSRIFKERLRAIEIDDPRLTLHSLRNTFITHGFEAGVIDHRIQDVTGHASVDMLKTYRTVRNRFDENAAEWKVAEYQKEKGIV